MKISLSAKIPKTAGIVLVILSALCITYLLWERNRDPLEAINKVDSQARLADSHTVFDSTIAGKRYYTDIRILSTQTDTIKAIISFPEGYENKSLPVITILGGLRIARQNFSFIRNPGENIIVIYIYPYQAEQWEEGFVLQEIPRVRSAILKAPGQIVELLNWIQKQSWADNKRISLLGYSFGALFLPAAERVARSNNVNTGPVILSYGGIDFELLLNSNLKVKPRWTRPLLAWLGATMIFAVDPEHHAAFMQSDIYCINGRYDEQIPETSWRGLQQLIPEAAKTAVLDEGHMHPRKPELTQKLVDISRAWLKEKGVLN